MENIILVNGSPRAPRSNSKHFIEIFKNYWQGETTVYQVTEQNHTEVCCHMGEYAHVLLVFPLYADGLPVTLIQFLKEWERCLVEPKPVVHVLVNCGFLEPNQNFVAIDMIRLFCQRRGYQFGTALCIGAGEAILETPFRYLAERKIKKLARAIQIGNYRLFAVTMPLTKRMFLKASAQYWIRHGARNGVSQQQMRTMEIEYVAQKDK